MTLRNKLAIAGLSSLMFTGAAVGLTGVASAQDGGGMTTQVDHAAGHAAGEGPELDDAEHLDDDDVELSPEDEALLEDFDQCLSDNGIDIEAFEADIGDEELSDEEWERRWEAIEEEAAAAIENCDPILEGLSDEFLDLEDVEAEAWPGDDDWDDEWGEDIELSPEDEAVFERFDQCLIDKGIEELDDSIGDVEPTEEQWEAFDAAEELILESCEPILDELSEDVELLFEDCPDDHDVDDNDAQEQPEETGAEA